MSPAEIESFSKAWQRLLNSDGDDDEDEAMPPPPMPKRTPHPSPKAKKPPPAISSVDDYSSLGDGPPPVLLIDEVDRADDEFEAYLLEVLSDFQITVPELGVYRPDTPPIVVLTSHRPRDAHAAETRVAQDAMAPARLVVSFYGFSERKTCASVRSA